MSVEVTIEGLDRWLDIVDPVRFTNEIDKAVDRAAGVLRDETKKMPPVNVLNNGYDAKGIPVALHGGTMRQGIQKRKIALMAAEVFAGGGGSGYSEYVHGGTSKMQARPYFKWLLEDFQGLQMIDVIVSGAMERVINP